MEVGRGIFQAEPGLMLPFLALPHPGLVPLGGLWCPEGLACACSRNPLLTSGRNQATAILTPHRAREKERERERAREGAGLQDPEPKKEEPPATGKQKKEIQCKR